MILLALHAWAIDPSTTQRQLVSANGYGALVWDTDRLSHSYPHLYAQLDVDADEVEDILYDSYGGVTDYAGTGRWFTSPSHAELVDGTGIINSEETWGNLEVSQYAFVPMTLGYFGVAIVYRIHNASSGDPLPAFQFTSLHNWDPGSESFASPNPEQVTEDGGNIALFYRAPGADAVTCEEGYDQVTAGGRLVGECAGYDGDDVPVFGWNVPSIAAGEDYWVGVLIGTAVDFSWMNDRPAEAWLTDEIAWWSDFQASVPEPEGLTLDEERVWRQQVAFLRMGQVAEEGAPLGQIPASLPGSGPATDLDHIWNITWPRHAAYSAVALAQAGQVDSAAAALRFLLQDKAGTLSSYIGDVTYGLSVCRTYGDGSEWSDDDGTGPNIELDGFGAVLWALDEVVAAAPDDTILQELGPLALDAVADPLMTLIDLDNNLIIADSTLWEKHWSGYEVQSTYTSVMAVAGLRAASDLAAALGDDRAGTYENAATAIQEAIQASLVDGDGVLASSVEELATGYGYLDVAVTEAWNQGVLDPAGPELGATFTAFDASLGVSSGAGYMRNDDAGFYDQQDWVFTDIAASRALRRACRQVEANALLDFVTQQALVNERVIPEVYTADAAEYGGAAPMLGYGAASWMIAMEERAALDAACPPVPDDTGDTGGDTGGDTDEPVDTDTGTAKPDDCGCVTGGGFGWVGLLAVLGLRRRR